MGEGTGFYPAGQAIKTGVEKEPVRPWLISVQKFQVQKREDQKKEGQAKRRAMDRRPDQEAVAQEAERQRQRDEDGLRRESPVTGGAASSNQMPAQSDPEEMKGKEEGEEERIHSEMRRPKKFGRIRQPTSKQIETHRLNHLPYAEWCPICVGSKGRERPHFKKEEEDSEDRLPQFGLDCGFFNDIF